MWQMQELTDWIELAPPLVEWGWSEGAPSSWAHQSESIIHHPQSFAYAQLCARMSALISTRVDASLIPASFERIYGSRSACLAWNPSGPRGLPFEPSQIPTLPPTTVKPNQEQPSSRHINHIHCTSIRTAHKSIPPFTSHTHTPHHVQARN